MAIEFIYFDLDDTLLDHGQAERSALADVCRTFEDALGRYTVEHVCATYHKHNVALWRRYSEGEIAREELQRLRFEHFLAALEIQSVPPEELGACYLEAYAQHWTLFEGALEAFETLAARYPVGVITNGFAELQHAKLARFPQIRDRLDALIISDEVGYPKPHPRIFAHAADVAGAAPASILYVGNSYHSDVCGGYEAGWKVAWMTEAELPPPEMDEGCVFCFQTWEDALPRIERVL